MELIKLIDRVVTVFFAKRLKKEASFQSPGGTKIHIIAFSESNQSIQLLHCSLNGSNSSIVAMRAHTVLAEK